MRTGFVLSFVCSQEANVKHFHGPISCPFEFPVEPAPANERMVDRLIAEGAVWSQNLVRAFRETPRQNFLDRAFLFSRRRHRWVEVLLREPKKRQLALIYSDRALVTHLRRLPPVATGSEVPVSSSSQPSLMAQMLEDLRPLPGQRVLEIGAGTGYNAALLAHLVGPGRVLTVDVDRGVLSEAWEHLRRFPERKVTLQHADGRKGFAERAPYDRIMVTAAATDLEIAWLQQLAPGGLLLAPLTLGPGLAFILCGTMAEGQFRGRLTRAAYFMPLRSEGETGRNEDDLDDTPFKLTCHPAPWEGWFEKDRSRQRWFHFVQALAFLGYLQGLKIHHRPTFQGPAEFGINSDPGQHICWFGHRQWHCAGQGREQGLALWQLFLEHGGPRPTEFILTTRPREDTSLDRQGVWNLRGPVFGHRWSLPEDRLRPPGW